MVKVRPAELDDLHDVFELAAAMHEESPRYSRFPLDADKSWTLLQSAVTEAEGCLLIAEHRGRIIGVMLAALTEPFFSRVRVSADMLLYIDPEYRGGPSAIRLIRAYEAWAVNAGAEEIQVGVSAGIDNDTAINLYLRLGYRPTGLAMTKRAADV